MHFIWQLFGGPLLASYRGTTEISVLAKLRFPDLLHAREKDSLLLCNRFLKLLCSGLRG